MAAIDHDTKNWIRNASDEKAVANGCLFDEARGQHAVDWIEKTTHLYEGDWAGEPFILMPWAKEATMRLFGWVRYSEKWKREIRRFRKATIFVPKKNGKSPLLAAWGLYLLVGDGERGQKVFLGAKDGQQAREIAGKHAAEMVKSSPALSAVCKVNKVTSQIAYPATSSAFMILSSSNSNTKESKEGLNGSLLIDEVHVVDADFMGRISRCGISRSEPLHIEVSTAGDNPDGYGKTRWDKAVRVESGEEEDQEFFALVYAAPQDLPDSELDTEEKALHWGRVANPAMGHTVDPEEYLKDWRESRKSLVEWGRFKMYRLNIWQHSSNPWLRASDWAKCRRTFGAEMEGRPCYSALDLSRTQDMTALPLVFPWPEGNLYGEDGRLIERCFRLKCWFWLPEERARELEGRLPIREWVEAGVLELTPGGVIDYGYIKSRFRRLKKVYDILEMAYDPRYAEEVTQELEQGLTDAEGNLILEGTGVPRYVFKQDDANYAAPTDDWERLVIAGMLHHDGNPLLTWQVGHAHVVQRADSKVKRVVKPGRGQAEIRTVDGVQAGIMALARALIGNQGSVYERRGITTIGAGEEGGEEGRGGVWVVEWEGEEDDD